MARGTVMFASPSVCRFQPLALALLLVACFAGHAYGSCLQYGHSCWGAHGKRSGGQNPGDDAVTGDGLLGPLAPASSSSSSPSSTDSETLWVLSKLMAQKALERKEAEGVVADTKDSNIWQRLLEAKKNSKPSEHVQQSGDSRSHSESNFDHVDLQNIDNAKKVEEIETRNKLESGGKAEREDEDDLALEDFEDYPFDDDEEEQETDGKTRDSRRYRYKLQKHWANRRKNRRPYRRPSYYYYKRW